MIDSVEVKANCGADGGVELALPIVSCEYEESMVYDIYSSNSPSPQLHMIQFELVAIRIGSYEMVRRSTGWMEKKFTFGRQMTDEKKKPTSWNRNK